MHWYMILVFLFLTYFPLTDSRFIHINTNDPVLFLFMAEYYHIVCVCVYTSSATSWLCSKCAMIAQKYLSFLNCVVVQSLSHVWLLVIPWTVAGQAPLSSTISWSLLKFMSMESVMLSKHLILRLPLFLFLFLFPSIFPSIRVFSNKSALHIRWPKYWSFSISPSS